MASVASSSASSAHSSLIHDPGDPQGPSRQRPRLPPEGIAILRDFYNNVSKKPTAPQMEAILVQIRAVQGGENYSFEKAKAWFMRHRQRENRKETKPDIVNGRLPSKPLCSALYPSFHGPFLIKLLKELVSENPTPSDEVLRVWCDQLKVTQADVQRWMMLEKEKEVKPIITDPDVAPQRQLPTPQSSTSPEPSDPSSPLRRLKGWAEVIADAEGQSKQPSGERSYTCREASTLEKFSESFALYEVQLNGFLEKIQSGEYDQLVFTNVT